MDGIVVLFLFVAVLMAFATSYLIGFEYVFQKTITQKCVASNWTGAFEYDNKVVTCLPARRVMVMSYFGEKQTIEIINFGGN